MRIALAGTFVGKGGVQTHFRWLSQALLDAGHDVRIFSLDGKAGSHERSQDAPAEAERFVFRAYRDHTNSPRSRWKAARAIIEELREFHPDVYLACGTGWNLFLPAWISRSCGRLVFHEVMSGESGGWKDSRWAVRWLFDEVIAQAEPVAENFRRTFHWRRHIHVLPAFSETFEEIRPAASTRVPFGQARGAVFGRLVPHKRVLWLVNQWPRLRQSLGELHIFGTGPDSGPIRDAIQRNGWADSVFYHGGYSSGQAYADLISSFDLTLLPTIGAEGAPLVLLESMACGVPFVSTDVGGIIDYANPDCVIVNGADPDSFLRGVETLCQNLDSENVMRGRLQDFYKREFSFQALQSRWCDLFPSLTK